MVTVHERPPLKTESPAPVEDGRTAPLSEEKVKRSAEFVASGFSGEAIAAATAVVVTIIGLAAVLPAMLAGVAVLAISGAMLVKAGSIAARFPELSAETGGTAGSKFELALGMSTELVAGAVGIVLGVLALAGVVPLVLLPSAAIVFGVALLTGGGETYRASRLSDAEGRTPATGTAWAIGMTAGGAETLGGVAAIVLGIVALAGAAPLILVLVALLILGCAQLLAGIAQTGRMAWLLGLSR